MGCEAEEGNKATGMSAAAEVQVGRSRREGGINDREASKEVGKPHCGRAIHGIDSLQYKVSCSCA